MNRLSVQPTWCLDLPLQQQSVLMLAARGPDGIAKHHPCKPIHVAYRGSVLLAARYGRELHWGEHGDSFMSLHQLAHPEIWDSIIDDFFAHHDSLPHHYLLHLAHGAEILAYAHPDARMASRWGRFYARFCDEMHLNPELPLQLDARLDDWARSDW